jgi:hypothetical protein
MRIDQLLVESPGILQSFERGLKDPVGGIKQAFGSAGGEYSQSTGSARSPYDVVDKKQMLDILDKIIQGQKLEPYQIDTLKKLQQSLTKSR